MPAGVASRREDSVYWCNKQFQDELPDPDLSEAPSAVDVNADHTVADVQETAGLSHAL